MRFLNRLLIVMKNRIRRIARLFGGNKTRRSLIQTLSGNRVTGDLESVRGNYCYINNQGRISIGSNVIINSEPDGSIFRVALSTYFKASKIVIGDNCKINGAVIHCNESVTLDQNCWIAPGTILCDNDSHRVSIDHNEKLETPRSAPITLESNVWIGMNCIVLKGVTIGENSIVAAGSIVTRSLPANGLYGGNPAKLIRSLLLSTPQRIDPEFIVKVD